MRGWDTLVEIRRTLVIGLCAADGLVVSYTLKCRDMRKWQRLSHRATDAEALQVVYDPDKVSYRTLLEFFYKMHDPTTENRQGPDTGTQYRSAIFYHDAEQEKVARDVTDKVNKQWWKNSVTTEILPAAEWWDAEQYHQLYLDNNPGGYECPSHFLRKFPDLE